MFIILRRTPEVPISFGVVFAAATLLKPFVLIAGMVDHEVKNKLHSPFMACLYQLFNILNCSVRRENSLIVRDVVAHVVHGRVVHWRQPDDIDSQRVEVGDFRDNTGDITPAVAIRIIEGSWVYLKRR